MLELSSASVGELSVSNLAPSASGGSDGLTSSESTFAGGSASASSAGSSVLLVSSLASAGAVNQGGSGECISCTEQILVSAFHVQSKLMELVVQVL